MVVTKTHFVVDEKGQYGYFCKVYELEDGSLITKDGYLTKEDFDKMAVVPINEGPRYRPFASKTEL